MKCSFYRKMPYVETQKLVKYSWELSLLGL